MFCSIKNDSTLNEFKKFPGYLDGTHSFSTVVFGKSFSNAEYFKIFKHVTYGGLNGR